MSEIAFQVHYQYLLSQYWMSDAKVSYGVKNPGTMPMRQLQAEKVELDTQLKELQAMYPEYYANWLKEHEMRERKTRTNVVQ
jgi:hypothetical protein